LAIATLVNLQAGVAEEVVASKSLTIQPTGPRSGDNGSKYFNVEGKDKGKYASFGVLVFEMKKVDASKIKGATLTLLQSIPQFAADGEIKIFLAPDFDPATDLKFDPSSDNGIGAQIKTLNELGSVTFKKVKTGESQLFTLKLDDTTRERMAKEGRLCLVITPADATVAATFFGAGESEAGNRPKLSIESP
jgi:hypothetical protein